MRISMKWLRELVQIEPTITAQNIADKLTLAGLEVEAIENLSESLEGVLVGLVAEKRPHPNADRLSVCDVSLGASKQTVVCGASNFEAGDVVAFAPVGTRLSNGMVIQETKIRGQQSTGMLCSEKELGLSAAHEGILVLSGDYKQSVGSGLGEVLELEDTVIEIGVTPNRPDALSHLGVAREVAALLGVRPRGQVPTCAERAGLVDSSARVDLENGDACPRYTCRVIEDVTVGPSPQWVVAKLAACGVRAVNNLVDITNLVMMERGIPLHAFDWDSIAKDRDRAQIIVRDAKAGERLETLDGKTIDLGTDDLVIADLNGPIALAGVMGGASTQVTETTTKVLLECAYFHPSKVRRSARRFGLHTESSHRFERGCDPNGVKQSLDRAAALIAEIGKGRVCRDIIDVYPHRIEPIHVSVRPKRAALVMGIPEREVTEARCSELLLHLGLEVAGREGDALRFRIPTYRPDLTREIDLIEELLRLIGYDAVTPTLPARTGETQGLIHEPRRKVIEAARSSFFAAGMHEAVNLAFSAPSDFERYNQGIIRSSDKDDAFSQAVQIQNPLGEEMSWLRFSLIPGLVENAALNQRRRMDDIALFEVGTVFLGANPIGRKPLPEDELAAAGADSWALEETRISGILAGERGPASFDRNRSGIDFFDAKGIVEETLSRMGIDTGLHSGVVRWAPMEKGYPFLHPGARAEIWIGGPENEVSVGYLGELHPTMVEELDMRGTVVVFELAANRLAEVLPGRPAFKALPKFPAIRRDLALVLDETIPTAALCAGIAKDDSVREILEDLEVFDIYRGEHIPVGKKSVALSLVLRADHRTLTDSEVGKVEARLIKAAQKNFGAEIRI
jgi:phenylalanyl-tRNA synthetase beta chain